MQTLLVWWYNAAKISPVIPVEASGLVWLRCDVFAGCSWLFLAPPHLPYALIFVLVAKTGSVVCLFRFSSTLVLGYSL